MKETTLTLTKEEQQFLVSLLERSLHDLNIEEHRTRTISYREGLIHDEKLLAGILAKLKQS